MALALINLLTGMIWARPIWNTWWTWDPRLTSEAIMILTYAAYLMLRNGIENPEQRRRLGIRLWYSGDVHGHHHTDDYPHPPGYNSSGRHRR